jgi:uncharacterized metal-binding protein
MADAPEQSLPQCALCPFGWSERYCRTGKGKAPQNCPSLRLRPVVDAALSATLSTQCLEFARQASIQEAQCYGGREDGYAALKPLKPRIVEIVEFARKMHFSRLGLVFCIGLRREAAVVNEILTTNGFEVASVSCKVGGKPKSVLGIGPEDQIDQTVAHETMCNPVLQAMVVNEVGTDFNILLGLCVGHDSLFFKHSQAMGTVLAVKDRLLGHNPLAAVYQYESYYRYLKKPLP